MEKTKTSEIGVSVYDFVNSYAGSDQEITDSFQLIELMQKWSGFKAKMWGPSIIGFGSYHYKYAIGHEGEEPLLGFSPPRKPGIFFYLVTYPGAGKYVA